MTYKSFRKIQVYILISLSCFIFTKNFRLIFNTRSILETDRNSFPIRVFLIKSDKSEVNTNFVYPTSTIKPSNEVFATNTNQYIKDKQTESVSRSKVAIDRLVFWLKRLIDGFIHLLKYLLTSVKYRYLLSQKSLEVQRKIYLKRLECVVGSRGVPLVKGILFGDVSGVDRDTYHSFKVIGMLHVLSASSANFTVFLHFCLFFMRPILNYFDKKQLFWLNFLIIFLYFSLVGPVASTIRAFLTLSAAFIATFIFQKSFLPIFNLYLAGILMLTINPFFVETLGFQFSFLASFGLLFLYDYFEKEPFINKNYLLKNILLTFCAQFFLIPILIFNFAELNYLAILANFLVLPLVDILTILFLASFIGLFVADIFQVILFNHLLSFLISKTLDILFLLINFLEKIPWKSIIFNDNKDLYTAIFTLINLLSIAWVIYLKNQKYSKNKYRVFK